MRIQMPPGRDYLLRTNLRHGWGNAMRGISVLRAFDLAGSTIDVSDCFGLDVATAETPSFTSTVKVGFANRMVTDARSSWWSREINFSEYQLYRWLRDRGADDGETVLVCWAAGG